jgi:hypothetical protein
MGYAQRCEVTPDGEQIWYDVDDAWVLANKPHTLLLTIDKVQIIGDGEDTATVTIQLRTPILTDGTYQNVAQSDDITLLIDDNVAVVTLDGSGAGTHQIASVEVGVFDVRGYSHDSNIITIEVI